MKNSFLILWVAVFALTLPACKRTAKKTAIKPPAAQTKTETKAGKNDADSPPPPTSQTPPAGQGEQKPPAPPASDNPLLAVSNLPHGAYPWDKIKPEHVIPALEAAAKEAEANFKKIVENPQEPTFENTVAALESFSSRLSYAAAAYYGVSGLLQEQYMPISEQVSGILQKVTAMQTSSKPLFERVKSLYERRDGLNLTPEQKRMIELQYESLIREGIGKDQSVIGKVNEIKKQIGSLQAKFGQNSNLSKETFKLHITDENELKGIPDRVKQVARQLAQAEGKDGFILNLDTAVYVDVMENAESEALRKTYWLAYQRVAYGKGPLETADGEKYDNRQILLDIVRLRHEKAELLGFKNHAEYKLQDKMARDPETVSKFMGDLLVPIKELAQKEHAELRAFKKAKTGDENINAWDQSFWVKRFKTENLGVDNEKIRQYFNLEKVLNDGVFELGRRFWNLKFEKKNLPVFHPDAEVYEVIDGGQVRALLYIDLYARKGKRSGAWMAPLRARLNPPNGDKQVAIIHLVTNIVKAPAGQPTLLSLRDTETLFHEMGHAYHALLSDTQYGSVAGSSVAWDFVEVPSQVPENFVMEKEVLQLFAKHHETGEVIPEQLIRQVLAEKDYRKATFELGQMRLAYTDMAWYTTKSLPGVDGVGEFEKNAIKDLLLEPLAEDVARSPSFGHIFAGGYDAGYYGYQWARVIGADLYAAFTENGFSLEKALPVAQRLREEILSKGNTAHAAELFRNFRGRPYDNKFFLKDLGLEN